MCAHIFHILAKTIEMTASRNCLPFYHLIAKILKLKGVHPSANEHSYPQPSPINIYTLNASIGHTQKRTKHESHALQGSSNSSWIYLWWKARQHHGHSPKDHTKISGLATIMQSQHIRFDTKFISLPTQLDQI